jgi:UDP-N-acetylglucosamine 2-epimerase (non-hydrolysing)
LIQWFHAEKSIGESNILSNVDAKENQFVLFTFHRPANVDSKESLEKLVHLIVETSKQLKVVFPIHPRTRKKIKEFGLDELLNNQDVTLVDPLGYFEFMKLVKTCRAVITDSGGIQEESTFLGVPCLTVRPNTERPVTVTVGTNTLLPLDVEEILRYLRKILDGGYKKGQIPQLWDGRATERIVDVIANEIL